MPVLHDRPLMCPSLQTQGADKRSCRLLAPPFINAARRCLFRRPVAAFLLQTSISSFVVVCAVMSSSSSSGKLMGYGRRSQTKRRSASAFKTPGNGQLSINSSYYILCMVHGVCTIVEGSRENHTVLNMSARQARAAQGLFRWPPQYRCYWDI